MCVICTLRPLWWCEGSFHFQFRFSAVVFTRVLGNCVIGEDNNAHYKYLGSDPPPMPCGLMHSVKSGGPLRPCHSSEVPASACCIH